MEEILAGTWQELLRLERVGRRDHFFELGGHSLLAMRMISRARERTGVPVPIRMLYESPTLARLAQQLQRSVVDDRFQAAVPLRRGGSQPPLICLPPAGSLICCYASLAAQIPADCTVYGLQAPGVLGWSIGGLLAHELATELQARGEDVALPELGLEWPADLPQGESLQENLRILISLRILSTDDSRTLLRMARSFQRAGELTSHFTPRRFLGSMLFFRATGDQDLEIQHNVTGWPAYVSGTIAVHDIPSTHCRMLDAAHQGEIAVALMKTCLTSRGLV